MDAGDVFTYPALCRTSRLIVSYAVGKRTQETTDLFAADLRSRLLCVPVISIDGFRAYPLSLAKCFEDVDAGQVIKQYGYRRPITGMSQRATLTSFGSRRSSGRQTTRI